MTTPDWDGTARLLAIVTFLREHIAHLRSDELGPRAAETMPPGLRVPVMLGGQKAATVSMPEPAVRPSVTDPGKFLAWTEENRPDEVVTVRQVRASFTAAVLRSVKEHGGLLDKQTGEVTPVPGVEAVTGSPSVRVELAHDAGKAIGEAWRAGDIDLGAVLALPAGGDSDA